MSDDADVPSVTCANCGHTVKCIRVSDGTIYRPFAWMAQPDGSLLCRDCQPVEIKRAPGSLMSDAQTIFDSAAGTDAAPLTPATMRQVANAFARIRDEGPPPNVLVISPDVLRAHAFRVARSIFRRRWHAARWSAGRVADAVCEAALMPLRGTGISITERVERARHVERKRLNRRRRAARIRRGHR